MDVRLALLKALNRESNGTLSASLQLLATGNDRTLCDVPSGDPSQGCWLSTIRRPFLGLYHFIMRKVDRRRLDQRLDVRRLPQRLTRQRGSIEDLAHLSFCRNIHHERLRGPVRRHIILDILTR